VYVNPNLGIVTSGRAPSLDEAKAQSLRNWQKVPQLRRPRRCFRRCARSSGSSSNRRRGSISALRVTGDPAKGDPGGEAPRPRPPPPHLLG
jgi:hypothetical protein